MRGVEFLSLLSLRQVYYEAFKLDSLNYWGPMKDYKLKSFLNFYVQQTFRTDIITRSEAGCLL